MLPRDHLRDSPGPPGRASGGTVFLNIDTLRKEVDVKKLAWSFGLGCLALFIAGNAGAEDEHSCREHGVKKSVAIQKPDSQTRLAVLRIIREAGSKDHRVRANAYRQWFSGQRKNTYLPLITGLTYHSGYSRSFSAWALGELRMPAAIEPLSRRALYDEDSAVRRASVDSIKKIGKDLKGGLALEPFLRALNSKFRETRTRAVKVLGDLGDRRAVPYLIDTLEYVGGPGPRVNLFVGRQRAYIRGYDVNVASSASIAKPVIGLVQAGAVLDARVIRTMGRIRVFRKLVIRSLEKISSRSFGEDVRSWRSWYEKEQKRDRLCRCVQ